MKVIIDKKAEEQQAQLKLSVSKLIENPKHVLTSVDYESVGQVKSVTVSYLVADDVETEE